MHKEVRAHISEVRKRWPHYFFFKRVLEGGSLNVNGSAREYFYFCRYFGIDLAKGRGVDMVVPMKNFRNDNYYDVVITTEALEHDFTWEQSLLTLYNNTKPNGLLLVTCAAPNRPEHGTKRTTPQDSPFTTDYYRNISMEDFQRILPANLFQEYNLKYERDQQDLMFYGIKIDDSSFGVGYR